MGELISKWVLLSLMMISVSFVYRPGLSAENKDNLLENGGFEVRGEDGLPRGWRIIPAYAGKGEAMMDDRSVHSGKYSLKLKPNKKNTTEAFGVVMFLDPAKLQGKEVTLSGYAKLEGMGQNATVILLKTDRENYLIIPQAIQNEFFFFSRTFSVANSIPEAALLFLVQGIRGSAWIDDLSLKVSQVSSQKRLGKNEVPPTYSSPFIFKINTPGWQDSAFISPDGQELYFAYMPYAQNDFMDILFGRISEQEIKIKGPIRPGSHGTLNFETYKVIRNKDGSWGKPINLNINSTYSLYSAKLSLDGKELYYTIRDYSKNYGGDDIYFSKKLPDGNWSPPENLGPNINTKYREDTPCLSPDGKTLYFNRNKIGESYGWEIMVSHRVNGKWTLAEKVGPPINQSNPEKTANHQPFVAADGKELYFTRIQQLYKSDRQPNGTWAKPIKVFPSLPVSGHASITSDGRYLYFLAVKDKESLKRQNFTIWYAERQENGKWGQPKPVD
jgi:Tol biopolymer transport system component